MKRIIVAIIITLASLGAYAQKGLTTFGVTMSYGSQTETIGWGVRAQHYFSDPFRMELGMDVYPGGDGTYWDVNLNANYLINLANTFTVYPIAGVSYVNFEGSHIGLNAGAGITYRISRRLSLNCSYYRQFIEGDSQNVYGFSLGFHI